LGTYLCFEKSKRELGRALIACRFAGAAGYFDILRVYQKLFWLLGSDLGIRIGILVIENDV